MKRINGTTFGNNTQHLKVQSDPLDTQHCVQAITHEKICYAKRALQLSIAEQVRALRKLQ
jgi:hypothetical protein